jgi:hypothetical protein
MGGKHYLWPLAGSLLACNDTADTISAYFNPLAEMLLQDSHDIIFITRNPERLAQLL